MAGNLTKRMLFAVVAIPATAAIIWLGGWWLVATIAVLGVLGAQEVYAFARRQNIEPLAAPGYAAAAAIPLLSAEPVDLSFDIAALIFTGWLLGVLAAAMRRGPTHRPLTAVAVTMFGALYASLPLSFLIDIRGNLPRLAGFALVLLPLVLTWICDTAAYMVGSQFGGPKMAPVLSPRKTWSGAVGGAVGALIAAVALSPVLERAGINFTAVQLLGLGLVVAVVGQVGDVAESLLKREVGLKDSSNLLPGHGGILDRLDSLYFVIPASAALFHWYGAI